MPTSPQQLFKLVDCELRESVPWKTAPMSRKPGVYVLSMHRDPHVIAAVAQAPIDSVGVEGWLNSCPDMTLDGLRPELGGLVERLASFWLPDETILYIGKANSLRKRLQAYYSHKLGKKGPHSGGQWVKTLRNLDSLAVHYAEINDGRDPQDIETRMLTFFMKRVSPQIKAGHPQPDLAIPFANLKVKGGGQRRYGIRHSVGC